jgi:sugar transferase EpsL
MIIKRVFDFCIAAIGLLLISPALVLLALLIKLKLGYPIIYKQQRPGFDGKPFTLYKYRTMSNTRDKYGNLLPDAQRIPPFGNFLRSTSLDELPELFNVLKGDMSLVGPRPLLMQYLDRYSPEQKRRHEVRPGVTGWAQINGRNAISWQERFALDVWYVDHKSFFLDIKILFLTVGAVLTRKNVTPPGQATIQEFMGN